MRSVVDRTSLCGAYLYSICLLETFKPAVYQGKIKKIPLRRKHSAFAFLKTNRLILFRKKIAGHSETDK